MTKILAWCDAPTAPTGFGRSSKHVLHALHSAGYEITQLAVNFDPATASLVPWKIIGPTDRANDPYGMQDIAAFVQNGRFDLMWTTFDPEVPWKYRVAGIEPPTDALSFLQTLRVKNPGFKIAGWFPVDGGPLSDYEMSVLGLSNVIDRPATMSPHVYDLIEWTMRLRGRIPYGQKFDRASAERRLLCIPHGVDLDAYRIPTDEERAEAKIRLGFAPDDFVILQVERNQQRKVNFLALSVLERLRKMKPKGIDPAKIRLFQHCIADEENAGCRLGFNLPDLAWRYGLTPGVDVKWPGGFVDEKSMVDTVYAGADVFLSCSTGEGFQYPAWEALACGVPLVVPNADARKAWFGDKGAPNVRLYDARSDSIVMRGGYGRRMALPDPTDAAQTIARMIPKRHKRKNDLARREGREWVRTHADVKDVQRAWIGVMDAMRDELMQQRTTMRIVIPSDEVKTHVRMIRPGLGDLLMATPALRVLQQDGPVALEVDRSQLDVAALLGLADKFTTPQGDKPKAERVIDLTELYQPKRSSDWVSTEIPRFEVIARFAGVDPARIEPVGASLPERMVADAESGFADTFGVSPANCIGLAFQTGDPRRSLPKALYRALHPKLKSLGMTPVVLGREPMGIRHVGVIDLTGQTEDVQLLALIANLGAVVAADSGILHLAGILGVPTVGCYTLFSPESRWIYRADHEAVAPSRPVGNENFPAGVFSKAGESEWSGQITATEIDLALRRLFDLPAPEMPEMILPGSES